MPSSAQVERVPHQLISIPESRQRKEFNNLETLAESISRVGLLNPIIVTRDFVLVAGERRFRAWKSLAEAESILGGNTFDLIPVHYLDQLDSHELRIVELDENLRREDLPWQEQANAVKEIHELLAADNTNWSLTATAARIGLHNSVVSRYVNIMKESASNERILSAPTVSSALNIIKRSDERKTQNAENVLKDITRSGLEALGLADLTPTEAPPAEVKSQESIICGDTIKFMATYTGERFNLIHCDLPYGINFQSGWDNNADQWGSYDDSPEVYWTLLTALANFWDNMAAPSSHLMFWYSMKYYSDTMRFFNEKIPSITLDQFPLVWLKSDNRGSLPDPNRGPRRVYETALFGHSGDRKIIKAVANAYAAPTQKSQAAHISEKPEPVLRHFFSMLVDEQTTLFDPTCGGGSALRAAESLGARRVLGVELNEDYANVAVKRLNDLRRLPNV